MFDFDAADDMDHYDAREAIRKIHAHASERFIHPGGFGIMADAFRECGHEALGDAVGMLAAGRRGRFPEISHPEMRLEHYIPANSHRFSVEGVPFHLYGLHGNSGYVMYMQDPGGESPVAKITMPHHMGEAIKAEHQANRPVGHAPERMAAGLGVALDRADSLRDSQTTPYGDRASWASATGLSWPDTIDVIRMAASQSKLVRRTSFPVRMSMTNVDEQIARALYEIVRTTGGSLSLGMIRSWIQGLR